MNTIFPGMGSAALPVFRLPLRAKIGDMSVTRHQVPITPAWAITEYKAQGSTYDSIVVDLHRQNANTRDGSSHQRNCSIYVQLSRTRSLQGLSLLEPVTLNDLNSKPNDLLLIEDRRITQLAMSTDIAWKLVEDTW
jgi:hypothetical protein